MLRDLPAGRHSGCVLVIALGVGAAIAACDFTAENRIPWARPSAVGDGPEGDAGPQGGAAGMGGGGWGGEGLVGAGGLGGEGGGGIPAECHTCHGSSTNPAPPVDVAANVDTSSPGVGAHQSHLAPSSWHGPIRCDECHPVPNYPWYEPGVPTHMNGEDTIEWGPLAQQGTYDDAALSCTGAYCHGGTLGPDHSGAVSNRTPLWTTVDGSQIACGTSCHTLPPGGNHPDLLSCERCHDAVITAFDPGDPAAAVWNDADLHVNGAVDVLPLSCTTCHGDPNTNEPAPPTGTQGETQTTEAAVGAHAEHLLQGSGWHRDGQCADCHPANASELHTDGLTDFSWGHPSDAQGATPSYAGNLTCTGAYCHGATLLGAKPGGVLRRTPDWTLVDGSYDSCGDTCHTNPPGAPHRVTTACPICHSPVIASFEPLTETATWLDPARHIDGVVDSTPHHDLPSWTDPLGSPNHHGSSYFLTNQQQDEHGQPCTDCHGVDLDGGVVDVSCNEAGCHGGQDWRSCTYCHGTPPAQDNPPQGVGGETLTNTLAVGRHVEHLTASSTHVAYPCGTCHSVPAAGDVSHALQYAPTADLQTPGHHGDVAFSGAATGMVFDVDATSGNPVTARGTCLQACHSDALGGPPNVLPYWAGGSWTPGDCGNCHDADPSSGEHNKHTSGGSAALLCTDCHEPASSPSHTNGQTEVFAVIPGPNGGSTTVIPPGGPCGPTVTCNGQCHNHDHVDGCW